MSSAQLLKSKKRALFKSRLQKIRKSPSHLNSVNLALVNQLSNLITSRKKQTIASYRPLKGEISPSAFEQSLKTARFVFPQFRDNKMVFVPSNGEWELGPWPQFFQPKGQGSRPVYDIDVFLIPGLAFDREGRRLGRGGGWYDRVLHPTDSRKPPAKRVKGCRTVLSDETLNQASPAKRGRKPPAKRVKGCRTVLSDETLNQASPAKRGRKPPDRVPHLKIGLAHGCQISNTPLPEENHDIRMDIVLTKEYLFIPIHKPNRFFAGFSLRDFSC